MTRLVALCLSLPLALGSALVAGQQTPPGTAQKPAANPAAKQPGTAGAKQATSHHAKKKHSKALAHKGNKRAPYRPEYRDNSVEVINGDATKRVVFHDEQAAAAAKKEANAKKNAPPPPMKVEVMNGSSTNTQYFSGNGQEQLAAVRNQQVVIGVQSSNTRTAGGNKHPVVTSVNSAGSGDAETAAGGGQAVTNGVSPRPKRPAYQPDEH
jgi:hypothetical protein